mmetsp:Transcript_21788/g.40790  ORF Transcript_21788/g.40790 Transcript_21788/m.40790 type:complete len:214 (-) Transcript_21788:387-1028(-)
MINAKLRILKKALIYRRETSEHRSFLLFRFLEAASDPFLVTVCGMLAIVKNKMSCDSLVIQKVFKFDNQCFRVFEPRSIERFGSVEWEKVVCKVKRVNDQVSLGLYCIHCWSTVLPSVPPIALPAASSRAPSTSSSSSSSFSCSTAAFFFADTREGVFDRLRLVVDSGEVDAEASNKLSNSSITLANPSSTRSSRFSQLLYSCEYPSHLIKYL